MKTFGMVISALMMLGSLSQGAHFVYQPGGAIWGQADRYILDSDTEVPSSPVSNLSVGSFSVQRDGSTASSYAYSRVSSSIGWGYDTGTLSINLMGESTCRSSDETAELWTYGDLYTLLPAESWGFFFTVVPDMGETEGMPIRVYFHWYAQCGGIMGNASASIGAFDEAEIYITRNVLHPVNAAPTTGIVWRKMVGAVDETSNLNENNSFVVNIGDTIGVFMGVHTEATLAGAGDAGTDVMMGMELLAGQAVPALIEYPYAPGLVYDPNQNITFIKDWSAIPGPVTWYDANALAQSFTYTTGRVTYSDWRLPVTIDQQGVSVGEIGHLNTHYFIDESFSGPFMNILPNGLYWTSPRFDRDPMPDVAYAYTFDADFGPAQWESLLDNLFYVVPVFDGPPREYWCPADFDSDGIVDLKDFAAFASYWLSERP